MAHNWAHKQQENASEIWGIITQRSRRELPKQEMGTLNRTGHEAMQALGTYGEVIDWTNKQASIGKALESNPLTYDISKQLRQSKIGDDILNFSYHDARQGAVKWIGGKNQAAGVAANILLPDAVDFIGGVGYADNLVKAVNKYGPDLIGRLKNVPNAQAILKRGGEEANKLLDEAAQGLQTIVNPNAGRVLETVGVPNAAVRSDVLQSTVDMPVGGFARGRNTVERVSDALTGRLKGQEQIDVLREAVKSGDKKAIYKALNTTFANVLDKKYVDGRRGYYNIKRLVDDPELLTDIVLKQDEIAQAHFKLMKNPKSDALRRDLYEIVGDTYFNNKLVIYGKSKWKDRITDASNWLKDTHWHHIFGNREAAEFMLSSVARDPLVGVNLAKLMDKLDLTAAGVADNLMLMKSVGHNNLHELLRKLGVDPNYGRMGPADFADFSHAISEMATKGHRYGDKMGDLAGKFVPPDPSYVNELFGMVEAYSKANKAWRKLIESGGVWYDPNLRRIVPKGTKGAKFYDFTLSKTGKSKKPEVLGKRIQNLLKILEEG